MNISITDKCFLLWKPQKNTMLCLGLSASHLLSCGECKNITNKSITVRSEWRAGFFRLFVFISFNAALHLHCCLENATHGEKRLWQQKYVPQQYTRVCLQCRRPCYKLLQIHNSLLLNKNPFLF